jgi:curli biogenesis system outer membrane secretion channel CsgG
MFITILWKRRIKMKVYKKYMVKYVLIVMILVLISGCAATPAVGLLGNPADSIVFSNVNGNSTIVAELKNRTFSLFGKVNFGYGTFPSAALTAQSGNITKIATVEYYRQPIVFGLFITYITIVTGE